MSATTHGGGSCSEPSVRRPEQQRSVKKSARFDKKPPSTCSSASVAVLINSRQALATYEYVVPEELKQQLKVGQLVIVPVKSSRRFGFILELNKPVSFQQSLKPIENIVDTQLQLTASQIELAKWTSKYYLEPLSSLLALSLPPMGLSSIKPINKSFVPSVKAATAKFVKLVQPAAGQRLKGGKQQLIVKSLADGKEKSVKELLHLTQASWESLKRLVAKGVVEMAVKPLVRQPELTFLNSKKVSKLTKEQQTVVNKIKPLVGQKFSFFLLQGVTGSGKTEVYLELAEQALKKGRTALFLVPEVALVSQLAGRLNQRFPGQVCVYHSYLASGERYDTWWLIFQKEKKIVIGTRSALFLPFADLGLIIMDEEHETSYKQNQTPRYHARTVALQLAKLTNSILLLGSATPSIETKYRSEKERCYFTLTKRPLNQPLPEINIVDLRKTPRYKQSSLSEPLKLAIDETLDQGRKVILFLNRRGFAPYLLCRQCGYVPVCKNCCVALSYHRRQAVLKCHHCNAVYRAPDNCPHCQGYKILPSGIGTERVEEDLNAFYPEATIIRYDADTINRKDQHRQLLLKFSQAEKGILLGTQMIAKGFDFPDVTLVGVINSDTALHLPDFRATERTVQLINQVAGRSGRGLFPGRVIVQTYNPENYALKLLNSGYDEFYRQELVFRQQAEYPPYTEIINIVVSGRAKDTVMAEAQRLAEEMRSHLNANSKLIGPAPAPIEYLKAQYRWHFAIFTTELETVKPILTAYLRPKKKIKVIIDIDPVWLL